MKVTGGHGWGESAEEEVMEIRRGGWRGKKDEDSETGGAIVVRGRSRGIIKT